MYIPCSYTPLFVCTPACTHPWSYAPLHIHPYSYTPLKYNFAYIHLCLYTLLLIHTPAYIHSCVYPYILAYIHPWPYTLPLMYTPAYIHPWPYTPLAIYNSLHVNALANTRPVLHTCTVSRALPQHPCPTLIPCTQSLLLLCLCSYLALTFTNRHIIARITN